MWLCPECGKQQKQVMIEAYSTFDRTGEDVWLFYEINKKGKMITICSSNDEYIEGLGATVKKWGKIVADGQDMAYCTECNDEVILLKEDRV